jgi:hypothetical protein
MVVGLLVLILSLKYLYQFTETTGLFLGGLLIASGALGYAGGARKSSNLINLQLVASIIGVMLAFQFVGEVVRDAQVDCALAELYQRGKATERAVDEARQNEVMHAVFSRLNELEDSLSEAQSGASHHAELRREQQALRNTDLNYIRAKVDMVKRHAEEVLASVLKNEAINADTVAVMSEEEKASLRRRLDTADKVIERVSKAHGGEGDLTYEEYREVLAALTDAATVPDKAAHPELQQALKELPNMQAALQRKKADTYETLLVGAPGARVQRLQEQRRVRRDAWSEQFESQLKKQQARGGDYVADLPEHCVKETKGEKVVVVAGILMIALQLAVAYISLSLSFRLPAKGD